MRAAEKGGATHGRTRAAVRVALAVAAWTTACTRAPSADTPQGASPPAASAVETSSPASTAAASAPATAPATHDARPRVVFLGTSLTAGLGLDPDSAYPAVVGRLAAAAGTPIEVVNAGISGETSAGALRRVDWVLREPADVVVVETGANDGLRGQSADSLRANLDAILARVRRDRPAARVALVQMEAPRNFGPGYTSRFHAVFPAAARAGGVVLFPFLLDGVVGVPRLNQGDGVHPTAEGARRVGANVWKALQPLLADAARTRVAGRG
ncbi:hypothetical protein tb265_34520 [Gemmatimonadetes bacterium T265]|nr:hypothetical protein tb265_34520 [Gemmatimonadetes bacterium T265]